MNRDPSPVAKELAEMMYRSVKPASDDALHFAAFRAADLYSRATPAEILWAERFVRACIVSQRIA